MTNTNFEPTSNLQDEVRVGHINCGFQKLGVVDTLFYATPKPKDLVTSLQEWSEILADANEEVPKSELRGWQFDS